VIKFKCIYCGQRILAKDDGAGKKGKCPKCNHELVVPKTTSGRPAISIEKTEPIPGPPTPPLAPECDRIEELHDRLPEKEAEALTELFRESFGFLVPTYDKLSLLLSAITLLLLYFGNSRMYEQVLVLIQQNQSQKILGEPDYRPFFCFLFLTFFVAIGIRVFRFGEEGNFIKKIMMIFTILINSVIGIIAGVYIIRNTVPHDWLLVFPVWNTINCVLLLFMLFFNLIDEECISDRCVTLFRFCLGLTAVVAIFLLCNYVFKLHWAITFSICTVYTTSIDRGLQSVFPGLMNREDKQSED
jgi:DNA-directed RNA polymerase subunit RPC12/RpoP